MEIEATVTIPVDEYFCGESCQFIDIGWDFCRFFSQEIIENEIDGKYLRCSKCLTFGGTPCIEGLKLEI